eukprot:1146279-Pelagomonas_calceolata.AAC.6
MSLDDRVVLHNDLCNLCSYPSSFFAATAIPATWALDDVGSVAQTVAHANARAEDTARPDALDTKADAPEDLVANTKHSNE